MTIVLKISNVSDVVKTVGVLKNIKKRMPEMPVRVMRKWGKILERDMKNSARKAGIKPFTGTLYNSGIQWRQRKTGRTGMLFMRNYAVALDSMKPHFVNVTSRRSRLLAWAKQADNQHIRRQADKIKTIRKFPIHVTPHPFIRIGWKRARPKLRPLIQQETRLALRGG